MTTSEEYDLIYSALLSNEAEMSIIDRRCQAIAPYVRGDSVLDLGCGPGLMSAYVNTTYVGVDFSGVAIDWAKTHYPNSLFILDTFDGAPYGTFDTVLLMEVLEHLAGDERKRLLDIARDRSANRIIVTVPIDMLISQHIKPRWSRDELENLFLNNTEVIKFESWWIGIYD